MLSLLFFRQKKQSLEDIALSIQNGDIVLLNTTLQSYHPFIKKTVSSVCKRYIDESDDEFSIGLIAFNDALYKYETNKGASLLAFAEVVIKRRVIDYIRQQAKHTNISIDKNMFDQDDESAHVTIENSISVEEFERQREANARKEEIIEYKMVLEKYGLTFDDLLKEAPKHEDARINAMKVAQIVVKDDLLLSFLQEKKRLPLKALEQKVSVSRKTIERNRKYIIAISIILSGEYLFLQEYIKGRLE